VTAKSLNWDGPATAMPPLTVAALREAVAVLVPSRLPELVDHMAEAMTQATASDSLAPLRTFLQHWGMVVAIERDPGRAARLHECERLVEEGETETERRAAITEISGILAAARREIAA
jgi:hypothetical protein